LLFLQYSTVQYSIVHCKEREIDRERDRERDRDREREVD
jgi:hypothetical protein